MNTSFFSLSSGRKTNDKSYHWRCNSSSSPDGQMDGDMLVIIIFCAEILQSAELRLVQKGFGFVAII